MAKISKTDVEAYLTSNPSFLNEFASKRMEKVANEIKAEVESIKERRIKLKKFCDANALKYPFSKEKKVA